MSDPNNSPETQDKPSENGTGKSLTHGAFSNLETMDKRCRPARYLRKVKSELTAALGGDPSFQEQLIIQRAAFKATRLMLLELAALAQFKENPLAEVRNSEKYLSWANSLRLDLAALGLERRAKRVMNDLRKSVWKDGKWQELPEGEGE